MRHIHRFWGLGCGHLWGAATLPTQHARGQNIDPVWLCPFKFFLGVRGPQHEVQVCLPVFRLLPDTVALPLALAGPVVELASYSGLRHLAHITSSVGNAFPLPSLSGQAIYSSGPQLPLFPPAGNLDSSLAPYPCPMPVAPTEEYFSKPQKWFWVL